jgi:D-glycero-alpha-D-manno-heptose-7-phosphate kinase
VDVPGVPDLSRHLLVAYCGAPHVSSDVNGTWVRQFIGGETRAQWAEIVRLSRTFIDALIRGDLAWAQEMMNLETGLRRRLTPEVLDDIGTALVRVGCDRNCGVRFTGAGGGGCIWALGSPEQLHGLRPEWSAILSVRETARILDARVDPLGLL